MTISYAKDKERPVGRPFVLAAKLFLNGVH